MITEEMSQFEKTVRNMAQKEARRARLMTEEWYDGSQVYDKERIQASIEAAFVLLYAVFAATDPDMKVDNAIIAGVSIPGLNMVRNCLSDGPDGKLPPSLSDVIVGDPETDGEVL